MTLADRLRAIADALPSDSSAVTFTRADLTALLASEENASKPRTSDLSVEDVARIVGRSPSTVRSWLISGELKGYKPGGGDPRRTAWLVTPAALDDFRQRGAEQSPAPPPGPVDISSWRKIRGVS